METEYKILKDFIISNYKKDINLENDFTLAVSLGNILYQNIKLENTIINYDNPLCVKKILEENLGQICQGFQICYLYLLKSFNIKCHRINIYTNKSFTDEEKHIMRENYKKYWPSCTDEFIKYQLGLQHSHAITEFLYKDKYIIYDPTFNVLYKYKNKYIDHKELKDINNNVASDKITFEYFYNENKHLKHKITEEVVEIEMYKNIHLIDY